MSFITVDKLSSLSCYAFLCCEVGPLYLPHSYMYTVPLHIADLVDKAKALNLQQNLLIICYDSGNMLLSSRVFWVLSAVGYKNVKVLYGGIKACKKQKLDLVSEINLTLPSTSRLLDFDSSLVLSKIDFIKRNTANFQVKHADFAHLEAWEIMKELKKEEVLNFLELNRIYWLSEGKKIVFGEFSCFLGVLLMYLDEKFVSVVIDDNEVNLGRTPSNVSYSTVYVSLSGSDGEVKSRLSLKTEGRHLKSLQRESMEDDRISTNVCKRCFLF